MRRAIDLYKSYGIYSNTDKMLPSIIDGLIPVHRRLLFVLNKIAANNKQKTSTVIGELFKYHPHEIKTGPVAWAVRNEFAIGYGNWGSNIGIEEVTEAAPRYTNVKSDPWVTKYCFNLLDYVEWGKYETDFEEPKYIPTPFPFCLMAKKDISLMGFGIKTEIPTYSKLDLCKRLLFLLGKTQTDCTIKPYIPNCDILSPIKEMKKLLTTGEAKLTVKGHYTEHKDKRMIYIKGWPPRTGFNTIYKKIMDYKEYDLTESIGMLDESNIDNGTKIRIEVLKQRNTEDIYEHMKKAVDAALVANLRYCMYVVDDSQKFYITSVDDMLINCYNFYKDVYEEYCKSTINKLNNNIREIDVIKLIKPHLSTLNSKKDIDTSIKQLSKLTLISVNEIKEVIDKHKIKRLLTFNVDKTEYEVKKQEFENRLKNLESSVLEEYKNSLT